MKTTMEYRGGASKGKESILRETVFGRQRGLSGGGVGGTSSSGGGWDCVRQIPLKKA